jgi:coiled-coil domain-containing protein 6
LLKKIQSLKKEKETLANNYEREEEYLTNDLSRKLTQLRNEKVQLEQTLEQEQEQMVNKLMRKIEKLEAETLAKQTNLEQLRREKIELENTLEQEQESLVNRLWKRMDRLEAEKRLLQEKLDQPISAPISPRTLISSVRISSNSLNGCGGVGGNSLVLNVNNNNNNSSNTSGYASSTLSLLGSSNNHNGNNNVTTSENTANNLTEHIINLRREVSRLKACLEKAERDNRENMAKLVREEREIRDENIRLQRRLQMEVDRREQLCRHLSESESSLEMDDERHFNESSRVRTISSPLPGLLNQQQHSNAANTNINSSSLISQTLLDRCPTCSQLIKREQQQQNISLILSPHKGLSTKSTSTSTLAGKSQQMK